MLSLDLRYSGMPHQPSTATASACGSRYHRIFRVRHFHWMARSSEVGMNQLKAGVSTALSAPAYCFCDCAFSAFGPPPPTAGAVVLWESAPLVMKYGKDPTLSVTLVGPRNPMPCLSPYCAGFRVMKPSLQMPHSFPSRRATDVQAGRRFCIASRPAPSRFVPSYETACWAWFFCTSMASLNLFPMGHRGDKMRR